MFFAGVALIKKQLFFPNIYFKKRRNIQLKTIKGTAMQIEKAIIIMASKTRTTINVRVSVFIICAETIIYLLLYNLHDCNLQVLK